MKTTLRVSLLALAAAFLFGSCQKVETYEPKPDNEGIAQITFVLGYDNDATGGSSAGEAYPALPGNVDMWLYTEYSELGVTDNTSLFELQYALSGNQITVELPVSKMGTSYKMRWNPFWAEKKFFNKSMEKTKADVLFDNTIPASIDDQLTSLKPGQKKTIKILFVSNGNMEKNLVR